ncbi:MAG: hypothetical protein O2904_01915 [bacterium]|nr:hypothetical protein [bacterium]
MMPLVQKSAREMFSIRIVDMLERVLGVDVQGQEGIRFSSEGSWRYVSEFSDEERNSSDLLESTRKVVKEHISSGSNASVLEHARELIDILHRRGIVVVGIRNPLRNDYVMVLDDVGVHEIEDRLATLSFDIMLDYSTLFDHDNTLFYNGSHLNSQGSALYTPTVVGALE